MKKVSFFKISMLALSLAFLFPACEKDCTSCCPCDEGSSFTDSRDQKTYPIVKVGDKCWFAENLSYKTNLPNLSDIAQWNSTQQAAYCYYDNNSNNGVLYNWHAVNSGNICPDGWHVASDAEWQALTDHLGGSSVAGGKLKLTTGWDSPNEGATNESCFNATPDGFRIYNGIDPTYFTYKGKLGYWWTSTPYGAGGYYKKLNYSSEAISGSSYGYPQYGLSCRCVKD